MSVDEGDSRSPSHENARDQPAPQASDPERQSGSALASDPLAKPFSGSTPSKVRPAAFTEVTSVSKQPFGEFLASKVTSPSLPVVAVPVPKGELASPMKRVQSQCWDLT